MGVNTILKLNSRNPFSFNRLGSQLVCFFSSLNDFFIGNVMGSVTVVIFKFVEKFPLLKNKQGFKAWLCFSK